MMPLQNGWLRKRHRKAGDVWIYCHRRRRLDDKWVEATGIQVGPLSDLPTEEAAWLRVHQLGLKPDALAMRATSRPTFGELAAHYIQFELPEDQSDATIEKAQPTITKYKHYLNRWALPRWQRTPAMAVYPFEVETRLRELEQEHHLKTTTLVEIRKVMNLVYRNGQRCGFLPRTDVGNPMQFVRVPGERVASTGSESGSAA